MLSKAKVKYIQSLGHKKLRDQHGLFLAEGPKLVEEFLLSFRFKCKYLLATSEWLETLQKIDIAGIEKVEEVDQNELIKISQLATPRDVLAIFYQEKMVITSPGQKITLLLDGIRDPGNMGTIIRIADWFGVDNIICSVDSVDCYNPRVVQATMGSLARVNIVYMDLCEYIVSHPLIRVYAATLSGKSLDSFGKLPEGMLVIGNESTGIQENILKLPINEISINRLGHAESLNAAVACGIILYAIR